MGEEPLAGWAENKEVPEETPDGLVHVIYDTVIPGGVDSMVKRV